METNILTEAGVDCAGGVARFLGQDALYERFVRQFPQDPSFAALQTALAAGDLPAAFTAAHTLKGTSGNLSFNRLFEDIKPLVEALRAGDAAAAAPLFPPVAEDYCLLLDAIARC